MVFKLRHRQKFAGAWIAFVFLFGLGIVWRPSQKDAISTNIPQSIQDSPFGGNPDTGDMLASPIAQKPISTVTSEMVEINYPMPTERMPSTRDNVCSPLFSTPVEELPRIVSEGYHPPPPGQDGRHQGVDFAYYRRYGRSSIAGERVQAVLRGKLVGFIADRFPYGNAVMIETPFQQIPDGIAEELGLQSGESIYTLYAHLSGYVPLELGETIHACQLLGWVGKSGNAGVAHLHLETRIGKSEKYFPSMAFYTREATTEERKLYLLWRTSGAFSHFDPFLLFNLKP